VRGITEGVTGGLQRRITEGGTEGGYRWDYRVGLQKDYREGGYRSAEGVRGVVVSHTAHTVERL
jgi:hypothetical protein